MKRIARFSTLILFLCGLYGCSPKVTQTAAVRQPTEDQPETGLAVGNGHPTFVTDRVVEEIPVPVPEEIVFENPEPRTPAAEPLRFEPKETEHVRITYYDAFEGRDRIEFDLDEWDRNFTYPYPGNRISNYGMRGRAMHTGIDIKAIPNDTIRAIFDGTVRMAKLYSSYGNVIVIRHRDGLESVYSHNSKNLVSPNQYVKAGDPIALAGRTGRATTEHLHFELRVMGEHFDPNLFLNTESRTLKPGKVYVTRRNGRILASADPSAESSQGTAVAVNNIPSSGSGNSSSSASSASSASSGSTVHVVKKGDTLSSISRRYGTTVSRLCSLNGITEKSILSIGQRIKVR